MPTETCDRGAGNGVRLAKRVAELFSCSRREAELFIEGGWVTVDGQVVEEPWFKVLEQKIELLPGAVAAAIEPVTLLLNKPAGCAPDTAQRLLVSERRAGDDSAALAIRKRHFAQLTATMPLQTSESGLLVFTQDRGVARKLVDDAHRVEQELVVEVAQPVTAAQLVSLQRAVAEVKVSLQSESRLRFALKGARAGQIQRQCEQAGLVVSSIKRIRLGRLSMGKLGAGQWRYLLPHERF